MSNVFIMVIRVEGMFNLKLFISDVIKNRVIMYRCQHMNIVENINGYA